MITSVDDARAALRLPATGALGEVEIDAAFARLARRYPACAFPERFQIISEARELLRREAGDSRRAWADLAAASILDLRWLAPYLKSRSAGGGCHALSPRERLLRRAAAGETYPDPTQDVARLRELLGES